MADPTWRLQAVCRDYDPEWWFPRNTQPDIDRAVAICTTCPVKAACRSEADSFGDVGGVWGGHHYPQTIANQHYKSPLSFIAGVKPCGTPTAARRHWRRREPLCPACSDAINTHRQAIAEAKRQRS